MDALNDLNFELDFSFKLKLKSITNADEAACEKWKNEKIKDWEDGGKMKEKYPERADLDAFMNKTCYEPGGR